ncbi:5-deoxy-glucuronate isomerase [Lysinibacillus sp. NPDC098008]|uniref:5-deoxy-glucuronate isomerase n=1 Tax=Lysinibacillus sp. NPDC098008 TaxID=3364146 RepID=UPI0038241EE8
MSKLQIKPQNPKMNNKKLISITPESANWAYVGMDVIQLEPGDKYRVETGKNEMIALLLSGKANAKTKKKSWDNIGQRMSVFEKTAAYSVYAPNDDFVELEALTEVEVAICTAPGKGTYEARLIAPEDVEIAERGSGHISRMIHNVLPETKDADSLFIFEVFTPAGNWSSYPPHKHDQDDYPNETYLEETYYHKINPSKGGFAIQRVYTDDRSLDETIIVNDGDAVLVPKGHHPCSAPPGYELYYLNVMAGPIRSWKFTNDPDHVWLTKL